MSTVRSSGKRIQGFLIKAVAVTAMIMVSCLGPGTTAALAQAQRVVSGKVLTLSGQPQPNAIVYLQNDKTKDVKTFFSTQDGSYRFGQLSQDADYEVWAEYQGEKSPTKTVSSFDERKSFTYDLKLGAKK